MITATTKQPLGTGVPAMVHPPVMRTTVPEPRARMQSTATEPSLATAPIVQRLVAPPAVPKMGRDPVDAMALSANAKTAHLSGTVLGAQTVSDLLEQAPHDFLESPDPTPVLEATHRTNQSKSDAGQPLSISTLNVALLETDAILKPWARVIDKTYRTITGWFGKEKRLSPSPSPEMKARREHMGQAIFGKGNDIILLQEVWTDRDARMMRQLAEERGYVVVASPRNDHTDGLMTFIKRSTIDTAFPVEQAQDTYEAQKFKERLFSRVRRGYQVVSFRHRELGEINLINTHTAPYMDDWKLRFSQARQLGIVAREVSKDGGLTLLGGDLNSAPFYGVEDWERGGAPTSDQMHSALGNSIMEAYGNLDDVVVAAQAADEVTADVRLGRNPPTAEHLPRYPFSSDRTNPLNASQYGTSGSLSRLDYIYAVASPRWKATSGVMNQEQSLPGEAFPLSDHYGFSATLRVRRQSR